MSISVEQKVIPFSEHKLKPEEIDHHALYVMEKLRQAGFTAYLVGGGVRDLLLGHKPKDFDISTSALPEDVKKIFRNSILIGRRFRLAHIRFGKKIIEVATFRAGDTETEELIVRDNEWGYPEEDALRRDFTINGLFYDSENETIIDYVNGFEDIQKKVLRSIGGAFVRFKQDPVRMIRLLKFQARFGLEIDPESHVALLECRADIVKSAPARVLEELLRMLESGASHTFIRLLGEHGLMYHLVPMLSDFLEKDDGSDVFNFLQEVDMVVQDPTYPTPERPILLSCLFYPLLNERIHHRYLQREQTPHLGQVQMEARNLIDELFQGFFTLPRRLRVSVEAILSNQYRLTPLRKHKNQRKRIPRDPDFGLSLKFLALRSCLEPGLQKILEDWQTAMEGKELPEHPKGPRRRSRPRRKRSDG